MLYFQLRTSSAIDTYGRRAAKVESGDLCDYVLTVHLGMFVFVVAA